MRAGRRARGATARARASEPSSLAEDCWRDGGACWVLYVYTNPHARRRNRRPTTVDSASLACARLLVRVDEKRHQHQLAGVLLALCQGTTTAAAGSHNGRSACARARASVFLIQGGWLCVCNYADDRPRLSTRVCGTVLQITSLGLALVRVQNGDRSPQPHGCRCCWAPVRLVQTKDSPPGLLHPFQRLTNG